MRMRLIADIATEPMSTMKNKRESAFDQNDLGTVPEKPDRISPVSVSPAVEVIQTTMSSVTATPETRSSRAVPISLGLLSAFIAGVWVSSTIARSGDSKPQDRQSEEQVSLLRGQLEEAIAKQSAAEKIADGLMQELKKANDARSAEASSRQADMDAKEREISTVKSNYKEVCVELERLRASGSEFSGKLDDPLEEARKLKSQPTPPPLPKADPIDSIPRAEPVDGGPEGLYLVDGLMPGDTLNIRSGPGSTYSIVGRLMNGVRLKVTGPGAKNGIDSWLPCIVTTGSPTPPTSGTISPSEGLPILRGWVNSAFVSEIRPEGR